jgi:alpha-mannosidase
MSTEQDILTSLGITIPSEQQQIMSGAARLLILDASAHMDWDWLLPFPPLVTGGGSERAGWYFDQSPYPRGPVLDILTSATAQLGTAGYRYSICETGFLRGFAQADPAGFAALLQAGAGGTLRLVGGGITSADNLLSAGEAFIRNYLLGHAWLAATCPGVPPVSTLWIPDDFGQDEQLPIVVQAMGMIAAGFWRIPGLAGNKTPLDGGSSLATTVQAGGIDFLWIARDGSTIMAHWLTAAGYGQGNLVAGNGDITGYLDDNFAASPTPYIYVPVLNDFSMPNTGLVGVVNGWNASGGEYQGTTVVAVNGSFEEYAQLASFHPDKLNAPYGASFPAYPYWTGFLASRPDLKVRHHRATRNLLAAELFSVMAGWAQPAGGSAAGGTGSPQAALLQEAWELVAPSTHHDYLPGTAIPDVYHTEQQRLLRQADDTAAWLLRDAMDTLAGAIQPSGLGAPVAVFNALGFARTEVVELSAAQMADFGIAASGAGYQSSADGGLLFSASAPSLGYQTAYLGTGAAPANAATVTGPAAGVVTLDNGLVTATLAQDTDGIWQLTSVRDGGPAGAELLAAGAVGNELRFFYDGGDEYRLGVESDPVAWSLVNVGANISNPTLTVRESGPLRVTVRTAVTYDHGTARIELVREYVLHADEPLLRMRSTGAAPLLSDPSGICTHRGCSVVAAFPLAQGIDLVIRGTPYHWTDTVPTPYWTGLNYLPTHHFAVPYAGGSPLCALYHADIPSWGLDVQWNAATNSPEPNDGILYGGLWRNGDGHYYGWTSPKPVPPPRGTDAAVHVREYALRMPSTLGGPDQGAPLREALAFAQPLRAVPVAPWTGSLPDTLSLASAADPRAVVTTVKPGTVNPGDVVLRAYQPTNAPLATTLTLAPQLAPGSGAAFAVRGQTALEQELPPAQAALLNLSSTASTISVTLPTALTTLAVTPAGALSSGGTAPPRTAEPVDERTPSTGTGPADGAGQGGPGEPPGVKAGEGPVSWWVALIRGVLRFLWRLTE